MYSQLLEILNQTKDDDPTSSVNFRIMTAFRDFMLEKKIDYYAANEIAAMTNFDIRIELTETEVLRLAKPLARMAELMIDAMLENHIPMKIIIKSLADKYSMRLE